MAAKPQLRNLLLNKSKFYFVQALALSVTLATAAYYGVKVQRRKTIDEFYKNYDPKKDSQRKKDAGVFQTYNQQLEEGKLNG